MGGRRSAISIPSWHGVEKIFELTVWPYLPLGFTQTVIGFGVSELGAYLEFEA